MTVKPFDPNDPHDQVAEAARKTACDGLMKDFSLSSDMFEVQAKLCGYLTALVGFGLCATQEKDHRLVAEFFESYLPQAIQNARSIMELPPLEDA